MFVSANMETGQEIAFIFGYSISEDLPQPQSTSRLGTTTRVGHESGKALDLKIYFIAAPNL